MTPPKIRWGILSTGKIAHRFATALSKSSTGSLVAVASRTTESAADFAATYGIPHAHGDYQSLLENPQIDAVYIATPHPMHREWVIRCAKAGKAILCEKPAGMNRGELEDMLTAVSQHDCFFMEAFMYRCHPQTRMLRELIRSGEIGPIRMIHATFSYFTENCNPRDRRFASELGGGSILDVGCYGVSMVRLIAGEIVEKRFSEPSRIHGVARLEPLEQTDLTAATLLTFDNGLIAMIQSGLLLKGENKVRIEGEAGSITLSCPWAIRHEESYIRIVNHRTGETRNIETTTENEDLYGYEIDEVGRAIAAGEKESPEMSWQDSLGNAAVLDSWLEEAGVRY